MIEPPLIRAYHQSNTIHDRPISNHPRPAARPKATAASAKNKKTNKLNHLSLTFNLCCFFLFVLLTFQNAAVDARVLPRDSIEESTLLTRTDSTNGFSHAPLGLRSPGRSPSHPALTSASTLIVKDLHYESLNTRQAATENNTCSCNSGESGMAVGEKVGFGILMPLLVLLSGLFAGLTLGYMSLDETQLQVLAAQGTPKQKQDAAKIVSVTKDRHLLLTTLLIANMITNETLPIIADPLLGGGVQAVVVSTVLVIIFAELIPQSVCARYGLVVGAAMVWPTRIIIFILYPVAWPVSRILHWLLGAHSGIVYRRAELKELVTMHAAANGKGGDLKGDTIMIVGGALDLQEKVVKDAMTPIDQVFMLPLSAKLDYPTLERIVRSGHSRIPIYQEYDVPVAAPSGTATPSKRPSLLSSIARKATLTGSRSGSASDLHANKAGAVNSPKLGAADDKDANSANPNTETVKRKKILGTLLVKSCVLLDPEDATPISDMVINAIPTVPGNEPLLNVLNVFQEGRSHMAIVSSAHSRLADMQNRSASMNVSSKALGINAGPRTDGLSDIDEEKQLETTSSKDDAETAIGDAKEKEQEYDESFVGPDAPIGIITLEDVLEELIGEEIWDEYDTVEGRQADFARLSPPPSPDQRLRDPNDLQPIMGSEKEAMLHNHPDQNKTQHAKTVDVAAGSDSKAAATADAPGVPGSDSGNTSSASGNAAVPARAATDIPAISTQQASAPASKPMGAVRPVVVRSTTGTGQTSTATALLPENLLRGRRMGPGGTTTQPLPPGSVVQLAPPRLPSNSGTAGAGGLLNAPGTVLGSGSASAVGTPLLGGASPLLGGSSLMSTTSGPPSGGADTSLGGGAANTTASSGTNSAAAGPGSVSTTPVIGPARANRFKSTPVPRINAVRSRSIGPGPPAAVPTSTGATDPSAQAAVPGAAFLVASPPAIESETSPLDASIASLASLGGGPRDSSGNAQDNEGSDTTR